MLDSYDYERRVIGKLRANVDPWLIDLALGLQKYGGSLARLADDWVFHHEHLRRDLFAPIREEWERRRRERRRQLRLRKRRHRWLRENAKPYKFYGISERFRLRIRRLVTTEQLARKLPADCCRRSGRAYYFICPFHQEKTASLALYPEGVWKCYGCGLSGDLIDLVTEIMNLRTVRDVKNFFSTENFPSLSR